MSDKKLYSLPELPYAYNALEPYISEAQLRLHHDKHHAAYVTGANGVLERIEKARKEKADIDMKATLKELSFHIGGHVLHTLFWGNLAPKGKAADKPTGLLATAIEKEFGSLEQFKKDYTGPEYAERLIEDLGKTGVRCFLNTMVTGVSTAVLASWVAAPRSSR